MRLKLLGGVLLLALAACQPASNLEVEGGTNVQAPTSMPDNQSLTLDHLQPEEGTVLLNATEVTFSVDFSVAGKTSDIESYVLSLSTSEYTLHPFRLLSVGANGELNFSANISWTSFLISNHDEAITVKLYRVTNSQELALVKELSRTYRVACNESEFFALLLVRKFFGQCRSFSREAFPSIH